MSQYGCSKRYTVNLSILVDTIWWISTKLYQLLLGWRDGCRGRVYRWYKTNQSLELDILEFIGNEWVLDTTLLASPSLRARMAEWL
jgi:predicted YcjX-like family ATPase